MRVTADLFVSAILRRVFSSGGFAAVLDRGAAEAGAVFFVVRRKSGGSELCGPAPQTSYHHAHPDERSFVRLLIGEDAEISARLDRERRFDPDIWVVEIEPGMLDIAELVEMATP